MYNVEIKLSNICANYFAYFYRKYSDRIDTLPIEKKLGKMMDEELLEYFSNKTNIKNFLKVILTNLNKNQNFYSFNYNYEEEKKLKNLIKSCIENEDIFNTVLDAITEKNIYEVENAIEVFKAQNNGSLEINEQNYYAYWQRKLGIAYTADSYKSKNKALKEKIINEGVFSDEEIEILSVFCDWGGYMWLPIWKNINNVKILGSTEIYSKFENEKPGYVGKYSGDLITKDKLLIEVAGVRFSTINMKKHDTNGFW